MEHRTVSAGAAGEVVTLHHALKAMALARANHVNPFALVEDRDQHLVAGLRRFGALGDLDLALHARRRHIGLLVLPGQRLVGVADGIALHQPDLHGVVAVGLARQIGRAHV